MATTYDCLDTRTYFADLLDYAQKHIAGFDSLNGLDAEYYDGSNFENFKFRRIDSQIDFDWQGNSPVQDLSINNFSVRWQGYIKPLYTEEYTLYVQADDGLKLWVNNTLVIDRWTDSHFDNGKMSTKVSLTENKLVQIKLEYYENQGNARIKFSWESPSQMEQIIPHECLFQPNQGWLAKYYNDKTLTNCILTRIDPEINFIQDDHTPLSPIHFLTGSNDNFSAKWCGYLKVSESGNYRFKIISDDGVRFWLNGELLINEWVDRSANPDLFTKYYYLEGKRLYPICVEYFQGVGGAVINLQYSYNNGIFKILSALNEKSTLNVLPVRPIEILLHQPWSRLLHSDYDPQIHHQRFVIDILKKHIRSQSLPFLSNLDQYTFIEQTYDSLLKQYGITKQQLCFAYNRDQSMKSRISAQLGIDSSSTDSIVEFLFLEGSTNNPARVLNENNLKYIFGYQPIFSIDAAQEASPGTLFNEQIKKLKSDWMEEDYPSDCFTMSSVKYNNRPVLDPDIIGIDDFREPYTNKRLINIWIRRRKWIDDNYETIKSKVRTDCYLIEYFTKNILKYDNCLFVWDPAKVSSSYWDQMIISLESRDKKRRDIAIGEIWAVLKLKPEEFLRLNSAPDDYEDHISILTQVVKRTFFSDWVLEEKAILNKGLSLENFCYPISEPNPGKWPVTCRLDEAWIDPEAITEDDLPESSIGDHARKLLYQRRNEIQEIRKNADKLQKSPTLPTFENIFQSSLGKYFNTDNWNELFSYLWNRYQQDPDFAGSLYEEFGIMTSDLQVIHEVQIHLDNATNVSTSTLSSTLLQSLFSIITKIYKYKCVLDWKQQENRSDPSWPITELDYYRYRKAKLPKWRASVADRQAWTNALKLRNSHYLIDPDTFPREFLRVRDGLFEEINDRYKSRGDAIKDERTEITNLIDDFRKSKVSLETVLIQILDRYKLNGEIIETLQNINDFSRRAKALLKYNLSETSFAFLHDLWERVKNEQQTSSVGIIPGYYQEEKTPFEIVTNIEWDQLVAILLEIKKKHLCAQFRAEDIENRFALLPEYFSILNSIADVKDEKHLALCKRILSRKAQLQALEQSWREKMDNVDSAILPEISTQLIKLAIQGGAEIEDKRRDLEKKLFVDLSAENVSNTTLSQLASKTLQSILFSLYTEQIDDAFKDWVLNAPYFEEEWRVLGEYETWKSGMIAFIEPERMLFPKWRKVTSPVFKRLLESFNMVGIITPAKARKAALEYEKYFNNIFYQLKIEGFCWEYNSEKDESSTLYLFARNNDNGIVWCRIKIDGIDNFPKNYWEPLIISQNVQKIVGSAYTEKDGVKIVSLFYKVLENGREHLYIKTFNTTNEKWSDSGLLEISLINDWDAVLQQPPIGYNAFLYLGLNKTSEGRLIAVRCVNQYELHWNDVNGINIRLVANQALTNDSVYSIKFIGGGYYSHYSPLILIVESNRQFFLLKCANIEGNYSATVKLLPNTLFTSASYDYRKRKLLISEYVQYYLTFRGLGSAFFRILLAEKF